MTRGPKRAFALALGAVVLLAALVGVARVRARRAATPPPSSAEQTRTQMDAGATPNPTPFVGVVVSERAVDVVTRTEGLLASLPVKVGQRVAADEIVARIDAPKLEHDFAIGKAASREAAVELARARAEVVEDTRKLARAERLVAAGVSSSEEVERAHHELRIARLRIDEASAKVSQQKDRMEALRIERDALTLRAPFAGIVSARYAEPGSVVQSLTRVVRVVADGTILVRFAVPQNDVDRVRVGTEMVATCAESHGFVFATVASVAPEVDSAANMLFVEAPVRSTSGAECGNGEVVHVVPARIDAGVGH